MIKHAGGSRAVARCRAHLAIAGVVLLAGLVASPLAFAQKPKKKDAKPAATAPAVTTPPPPPAAPPETPAAADTSTSSAASSMDASLPAAKPADAQGDVKDDSTDVDEKEGKTYYFVGLRYRGDVIPKFMMNLFVSEGATVYSNTIGVELDIRKDHFSLIPAISYTEYGTGDILFLEKSKNADDPGNWSYINSSMKGIYATADLLWSTRIHKNIDFEYGAGFGLGFIFGDLVTNWVHPDANGPFPASTGANPRYAPCHTQGDGPGCAIGNHSGATVAKVGGYTEPSWVNGGSKPNIFPWISFPQVGLRFKPVKQFEGRVGLGFSLTGFWFGLSGAYGLPEKK